jgi:hypothetical protein
MQLKKMIAPLWKFGKEVLDGMSCAAEIEGIETKPLYGKWIPEYNQKQRAGVVQW